VKPRERPRPAAARTPELLLRSPRVADWVTKEDPAPPVPSDWMRQDWLMVVTAKRWTEAGRRWRQEHGVPVEEWGELRRQVRRP
jgi:hypothetical protein